MDAIAPDGAAWVVKRRWTGRAGHETVVGRTRRRVKGVIATEGDLVDHLPIDVLGGFGESVEALLTGIVVVLLVVFIVVPVLAVAADLAVLALAAVLAATLRTLLGRPWTIEAHRADGTGQPQRWRVKGWRASQRFCAAAATSIASGQTIEAPRS